MNLKGRMKKLQTAITRAGLVIKINTYQFYAEEQKRLINSYSICTPVYYYSTKKEEWRHKDYEILKTCSMIDIIYCLLDIYKAVNEWQKN